MANPFGDPEVVRGEQLSRVLRQWIVKYLAERPLHIPILEDDDSSTATISNGKKFGNKDVAFVGPIGWLAQETGRSERWVSRLTNGEMEFVGLGAADELLTAAGLNHMLGNEIEVLPSPKWSLEKWIEFMQERGCV